MEDNFGLVKDHPLTLEMASLRAALSHYEHASHVASIQMQRQALEIAVTQDATRTLLQRNAQLEREAEVLRADVDPLLSPAKTQVAEITLALRRANDRLSSTESVLLDRTTEVANLSAEIARAESQTHAARQAAANAREREEQALAREREASNALRMAVEERNTYDRVVQEYADLVKTLEGRPSLNSTRSDGAGLGSIPSLGGSRFLLSTDDTILKGHHEMQTLLQETNTETHRLHVEVQNMATQLDSCRRDLGAARKIAEEDRAKLALAQVELQQHKADDSAAARLVSRYMAFSQASIDVLEKALKSSKARHGATQSTLSDRIRQLEQALLAERQQTDKLRLALDNLTEDISRATFGRRREIALRLNMLSREEQLMESLVRWERKADEAYRAWCSARSQSPLDSTPKDTVELLERAVARSLESAKLVLAALGGGPAEDVIHKGSLGRLIMAQQTLESVLQELNTETEARLALERERGGLRSTPLRAEPSLVPPQSLPGLGSEHQSSSTPSNLVITALIPEEFSVPKMDSSIISSTHSDVSLPDHAKPAQHAVSPATQGSSLGVEDDSPAVAGSMHDLSSVKVPMSNSHYAEIFLKLDAFLHRYDVVQQQFMDCHRNLSSLKSDLAASDVSFSPSLRSQWATSYARFASTTLSLLGSAIARLDDFNEDAMVEIEIRISDDARLAQGFRTLIELSNDESHQNEIKNEVEALVGDKDFSSASSQSPEVFKRKLEDLEHDIAMVKLAYHKISFTPSMSPSSSPPETHASENLFPPVIIDGSRPSWSRWTNVLLTSGQSGLIGPASSQTFGSVMTSPSIRPSLHHSLPDDFLQRLDFRIAMPFSKEELSLPPRSQTISFARQPLERARNISGVGLRSVSSLNTVEDALLRSGAADPNPVQDRSDSDGETRTDTEVSADDVE